MTEDYTTKIINLMQFARKAGKLIGGADACIRSMHREKPYLIVFAGDTAERTFKKIQNATIESGKNIPQLTISTQEELSLALGLPFTGVFCILDKQFASKMLEYMEASRVEE
jgi:ribosomal protein L7Ae-like RNA K-turn-binding protein